MTPEELNRLCPFLFHLTHIENVNGILSRGLLANDDVPSDFKDISLNTAQDRRKDVIVKVGNSAGTVHDFRKLHEMVPFFFTPKTPMAFYLAERPLIGPLCLIVVKSDFVFSEGVEFSFSNMNLASHEDLIESSRDLDSLPLMVDWEIVREEVDFEFIKNQPWQERWEVDRDGKFRPHGSRKRGAEFLLNSPVPPSAFSEIRVKLPADEEAVKMMVENSGAQVPVRRSPRDFF